MADGDKKYPERISGGCTCGAIRYTITFSDVSQWPPYCSACQCTTCRKSLSCLSGIALSIPFSIISFPSPESRDPGQLKVYKSTVDVERKFCGNCGSAISFQNLVTMPTKIELWAGTLDEEVLIGRPKHAAAPLTPGEKPEREGGWGSVLCVVKETLFWGNKVDGVSDGEPSGRKWWGMTGQGTPFHSKDILVGEGRWAERALADH